MLRASSRRPSHFPLRRAQELALSWSSAYPWFLAARRRDADARRRNVVHRTISVAVRHRARGHDAVPARCVHDGDRRERRDREHRCRPLERCDRQTSAAAARVVMRGDARLSEPLHRARLQAVARGRHRVHRRGRLRVVARVLVQSRGAAGRRRRRAHVCERDAAHDPLRRMGLRSGGRRAGARGDRLLRVVPVRGREFCGVRDDRLADARTGRGRR